jgi:uncharacterized protein YdhG (YjbR/CyaY superfamily)
MDKFKTIDEYISSFPKSTQTILRSIRKAIQEVAPEATEAISYGMPTFKLNGNLIHFAAYKHHIGFYPTPSGVEAFKKDLEKYKTSKGAIQFPIDQPIPIDLFKRIVKYRVKEMKKKQS